jgi:nucleoside-diphosphate kinase
MLQKTLVLIKPDAMNRGLIGEIVSRLERVGLKLVACKLVKADHHLASTHYPVTEEWLMKVGRNTLADCEKYEVDVMDAMGTSDPIEIGKKVHEWNMEYILSAPILAMVWEGAHAVEVVRKLCGPTLPLLAAPGTIRGDFSSASAISENVAKSPIRNLVHASGEPSEAEREIELWFGKEV